MNDNVLKTVSPSTRFLFQFCWLLWKKDKDDLLLLYFCRETINKNKKQGECDE